MNELVWTLKEIKKAKDLGDWEYVRELEADLEQIKGDEE